MAEATAPQTMLVVTPDKSSIGGSLNVPEGSQEDTTGWAGSQSEVLEAGISELNL
jgi:hypothetical protein